MVKRILISPAACRISVPGVDVTGSPSPSQLIFDFLANQYMGVYTSGTIAWGASGWSAVTSSTITANDTTTYTYSLAFAKTFASPPELMWGVSSAYLNSGGTFYPNYQCRDVASGGGGMQNSVSTRAVVSTTGIVFTIVSVYGSTGPTLTTRFEYRLNMIYTVFQV